MCVCVCVVHSINFQNFWVRAFKIARRLMKIQYNIAIYLLRWLTNFYDFRFQWTATTGIGIHPTKARLLQLVNFKKCNLDRVDTLEERYAIKFCSKLGKNATETYGIPRNAFRPSCMNGVSVFEWHKRFKAGSLWGHDESCGRSKEVNRPELMGQSGRAYYVEVLREFMKSFRRKRPGTLQIRSVVFPPGQCTQSTTPSLLQTIWPRLGIKIVTHPPYFPDLAPCDFCLLP